MGVCNSKSKLEQVFETKFIKYDGHICGPIDQETYNQIVRTFPISMWPNFNFFCQNTMWIRDHKVVEQWLQNNKLKDYNIDLKPTEVQSFITWFILQDRKSTR